MTLSQYSYLAIIYSTKNPFQQLELGSEIMQYQYSIVINSNFATPI